jgi:hypothetical protein
MLQDRANDDRCHHGCNGLAKTFRVRLPRWSRPQEVGLKLGVRTGECGR